MNELLELDRHSSEAITPNNIANEIGFAALNAPGIESNTNGHGLNSVENNDPQPRPQGPNGPVQPYPQPPGPPIPPMPPR